MKNHLALVSPEPHQRSALLVPGGSGVAAWSLSFWVAPHPCGRVSWGDDPEAPPHTLLLPFSPNPLQEREMRRIPPGPGPCQDSGPRPKQTPGAVLGTSCRLGMGDGGGPGGLGVTPFVYCFRPLWHEQKHFQIITTLNKSENANCIYF